MKKEMSILSVKGVLTIKSLVLVLRVIYLWKEER